MAHTEIRDYLSQNVDFLITGERFQMNHDKANDRKTFSKTLRRFFKKPKIDDVMENLRANAYPLYKLVATLAYLQSLSRIYWITMNSYIHDRIYLFPAGGVGNIQHYYHFIVNAALPISIVMKYKRERTIVTFPDFGLYTSYLSAIFHDDLTIRSNNIDSKAFKLPGLNPVNKSVRSTMIFTLKDTVLDNLDVQEGTPNKILLIERVNPDDFFLKDAERKGAGSSRRSIINHGELYEVLRDSVRAGYELLNVQLENVSFEEQVRLFNNSVGVIGQHGAGLVNVIWMPAHSFVVEVGYRQKAHFDILSQLNHLLYYRYDADVRHVEIDKAHFMSWLKENEYLSNYFSFA